MTREEMLTKLKNIKPTACSLVMTYDMGMQFEIMTSEGARTEIGNYSDWPYWKFKRLSSEELDILKTKIENKTLSVEDFSEPLLTLVKSIIDGVKDIDLSETFKELLKYPLSETEKDFYVFCDIENWNFEILFFGKLEEMEKDFVERFAVFNSWEEMDNEELEEYCNLLDEESEGIPFYNSKDEEK